MNRLFFLLIGLVFFGCNHDKSKPNTTTIHSPVASATVKTEAAPIRQYKDRLAAFLDSVGQLPAQPLAQKAAFLADSIFNNQAQLNQPVSLADFRMLRLAARNGFMSVKTARRILNNPAISDDCTTRSVFIDYKKGLIPVNYFPFDKNGFNEYALSIGDAAHCSTAWLYFFKQRRIIAKHEGVNRSGLNPEHYKDADGKTVIYYEHNFTRGSGIWWYNYFFYKYDGNILRPVLNELYNGNLLSPGPFGVRTYWLESFVKKTNPLTIKMVYHVQLPDTAKPNYGPLIINDSTLVEYAWNEKLKRLEGQYNQSKITRAQILSYYVEINDLLFINSYYKTLKSALHDTATQTSTLTYLNGVKDYWNRERMERVKK